MILGEYDAQQAFVAFDTGLRENRAEKAKAVLTPTQGYSNTFRGRGGSQAASVMANTLRSCYGAEVLIAPAYSFTGAVLKADYTERMAGNMIMPNALEAYRRDMTGAELKACLKRFVEGAAGCFTPFNPGSLPIVSGITMDVEETETGYLLERVYRNGKEVSDTDCFHVICLNTASFMEPLAGKLGMTFEKDTTRVREVWVEYIRSGGALTQPEKYITLNNQ